MELYEMLHIQHGIVLIGETMSCKTTLYKMLAETLTCLADERAKSQKAQAYVKNENTANYINEYLY